MNNKSRRVAILVLVTVMAFTGRARPTEVLEGQFTPTDRRECTKWCTSTVSSAGSNNTGCTDKQCEDQWLKKKLNSRCVYPECTSSGVKTETWYSIYCGETGPGKSPLLMGCKVQVKDVGGCE